jgi:hypothetical protein
MRSTMLSDDTQCLAGVLGYALPAKHDQVHESRRHGDYVAGDLDCLMAVKAEVRQQPHQHGGVKCR